MYLLWMGLCIISAFIVYFFIPETARLPMEEIGALFGDQVVIHLTSDGHGILEDKMDVEMAHLENQAEKIVHTETSEREYGQEGGRLGV
jgi:Sugar (and other) transporter